jgi:hypothetical protein
MHNYMKNVSQEDKTHSNIFIYETRFTKYLTVYEVIINK